MEDSQVEIQEVKSLDDTLCPDEQARKILLGKKTYHFTDSIVTILVFKS